MNAWGSNTDRILLLLKQEPMTKAEICRRLDLTHDQVASVLSRLSKRSKQMPRRIHICGYTRHAISGRTYIRPVYKLGNKPHKKPDLTPYTVQERHQRSYQKLMATRNNSIFNLTKSSRDIIREKTQILQTKTNKDTYEQIAA